MHGGFHAWTQTESPGGRQLLEVNARIHATVPKAKVQTQEFWQTEYKSTAVVIPILEAMAPPQNIE